MKNLTLRRGAVVAGLVLSTVAVVADRGLTRESCDRGDAIRRLRQFVRAYNRGNLSRLDVLFAPADEFGWYRVFLERDGPFAEDRSTLIEYFAARHNKGDRLMSATFDVNEEPDEFNVYGFGFELARESNDPLASGKFAGKGGVVCDYYVSAWNMAPAP